MFSNLCDKIRVECQGVGEDVCVAALHGIILNGTDSEAYQSRFVNKSLFFYIVDPSNDSRGMISVTEIEADGKLSPHLRCVIVRFRLTYLIATF